MARKQTAQSKKTKAGEKKEYSEKTEHIFKIMLRTMSWTVGIAFASILILPYFNNPLLDIFNRYIFNTGLIVLILFTLIEFVADSVKSRIEKKING
ncbi:MAG TPA: hypothetical protein ENJ15_02430 [Caldithrix abyssi]|uniref:Uncharacterized protein n=1 Tax=Caldithrix abyssi TaxID=187145 RepID=A0A7V5RNH2_CALAY|nr:hypothetical protein [Caldithrix abyssi]